MRQTVIPFNSQKSTIKFREQKQKLIDSGEIPKDLDEQIEFFSKKVKLASQKADEEEHLRKFE